MFGLRNMTFRYAIYGLWTLCGPVFNLQASYLNVTSKARNSDLSMRKKFRDQSKYMRIIIVAAYPYAVGLFPVRRSQRK